MTWTKITNTNFQEATAYCSNTDYNLLRKFIIENNIVSFRKDIGYGTTVVRFFQNGGRSCGTNYLQMEQLYGHPFIDHYMFFKTADGRVLFTSQPYAGKEYIADQFKSLFSNDFKIRIYSTNESWYYPGETTLFVITLNEATGQIIEYV